MTKVGPRSTTGRASPPYAAGDTRGPGQHHYLNGGARVGGGGQRAAVGSPDRVIASRHVVFGGHRDLHTVEKAAERDDVAAVLEAVADQLSAGCPVATVALECAPGIDASTVACRDVFRAWVDVLCGRLTAQGWGEDAARDFATTVVAAVEGALLLARVERDAAPVRTVLRDLARRAQRPT